MSCTGSTSIPNGFVVEAGTDFPVTFTLTVPPEESVPNIALAQYRILDTNGVELSPYINLSGPFTPVTVGSDTTVAFSFVVSGATNALSVGQTREVRKIELKITFVSARVLVLSAIYIIQKAIYLELMVNSYQSYEEAILRAFDMMNVSDFNNASDQFRQIAMVDAYHRIGKLSFGLNPYDEWDRYNIEIYFRKEGAIINRLNEWPKERFLNLPEKFRTSICRAQIAEANYLLGGSPIEKRRKDGLMSETVGESSNMFRPTKPLIMSVSRPALEQLGGYVRAFGPRLRRS